MTKTGERILPIDPNRSHQILANIDTTQLTDDQKHRFFLLSTYHNCIYSNPISLSETRIKEGDSYFSEKFNPDAIKWLIIKSYDAKIKGNPVARLENLKDAEFIAIQLDRKEELAFIYLYLSNVYEQGFNGTVSKYYADKAISLFRELDYPLHLRDARMAVVGSLAASRDYKTMLDSLKALQPSVMAISSDSYKTFFLDQLARAYTENNQIDRGIEIWQQIYNSHDISANTLAHWAYAYMLDNKLDSALLFINRANKILPHSATDEFLCRNVEYQINEKLGYKEKLPHIDNLRTQASVKISEERQLEQSSLSLNLKYDSATRKAWIDAQKAKFQSLVIIFSATTLLLVAVILVVFLRKRNLLLRLQHENDMLKIQSLQNDLFESNNRNEEVNAKISDLFRSRFKLLDGLAATYFECKDTGHEQKRIYANVKETLTDFGSRQSVEELSEIINGYHDNLIDKFKADFPKLKVSGLRLAVFIFCGFTPASISIFTGTELKNLYVYKSRLKTMISKSDSPRKDEYLSYFV